MFKKIGFIVLLIILFCNCIYAQGIEVVKIKYIKVDELMLLLSKHPLYNSISPNPAGNSISITGTPENIEEVKKLINNIDKEKKQVEIQFAVLDTSGVNLSGLSIEGEVGLSKKTATTTSGVNIIQFSSMILGWTNTINGRYLLSLFGGQSTDNLKIMAKAKAVATDSIPATVFFGKKTYLSTQILGGGITTLVASPTPVETGVNMMILVNIIEENGIQKAVVTLTSEVSEVLGTGPQGLPVTNNRKITTTLTVKSGETIICGGMTTKLDYILKGYTGPKFMKYIPILNLFLKEDRIEGRTQEITMLITPTILPRPQEDEKILSTTKVIEERTPPPVQPTKK
jgi:type II secretory pathway component GspD/PulD (secretin)